MSLKKIHLRKLLQFFYLPDPARKALLRADIRDEIKKEAGRKASSGGDFHTPFWTDAKNHVAGILDLQVQTNSRVAGNKARARLYPQLNDGFLKWWNEKRRWRNEEFEFIPNSVIAKLPIAEVGGVIKIENLLALRIGDQSNRIIYPYFAEVPILTEEGARIGLWIMGEALPSYSRDDLRILDVLRGTSVAVRDVPFLGNERDLLLRNYRRLNDEWEKLREEYGGG